MSVITVENLGKKYLIGHDRNVGAAYRYQSLRECIAHTLRGSYQRLRHPLSPNVEHTELEEFWALRDLNFEIQLGDRVGIIGRNGAGKSTLLKILSRITEPTTGRIEIDGRVASLLEVGTGFHPELTGRENIFLNGAILGMSRAEIRQKFDEIVAFSEVEKFLDTPVKRYSSGMYVRLAFAVAAHLESEILIIDEVLAVGDAAFQKKCLGKMEDISNNGRTVLFVSHNMGAVSDLCHRGILIEGGRVAIEGDARNVIKKYLSTAKTGSSEKRWPHHEAPGDAACRLRGLTVCQEEAPISGSALVTLPIQIGVLVEVETPAEELGLTLLVSDFGGKVIVHSSSMMNRRLRVLGRGQHALIATLPAYLLNSGSYLVSVVSDIPNHRIVFSEQNVISFDVSLDCEEMGRYADGSWKGVTGPGIIEWTRREAEGGLPAVT